MKACKWDKKVDSLVNWTASKKLTSVKFDVNRREASDFMDYLRLEWLALKAEEVGFSQAMNSARRAKEGCMTYKIHKGYDDHYEVERPDGAWVSVSCFDGCYSYKILLPEAVA